MSSSKKSLSNKSRSNKLSSDKEQEKGDAPEPESKKTSGRSPKTISAWQDLVSQRIEDATQQGAFENLRGKGKPLDLRKNPFTPEGKGLAFDLLENNDLAPSWIMQRKETQAAITKLRTRIQQDIAYYRSEMDLPNSHNASVEDILPQIRLEKWHAEIAEINKQIDTLNLSQPIAHLEIMKLRPADELKLSNSSVKNQ